MSTIEVVDSRDYCPACTGTGLVSVYYAVTETWEEDQCMQCNGTGAIPE